MTVCLDTTTLQDRTQIVRNRHRLQCTDTGTARVSNRHPNAREHRRCDNSRQLAKYFAPVAHRSPEFQHEPMHMDMLPRVALAEDVRALEVMKRSLGLASDGRSIGGGQFDDIGGSKCADHWWYLTTV